MILGSIKLAEYKVELVTRPVLTKVPEDNYLLLPSTLSQLKMWGFGWLPTRVAQYLIGRQYRKSWQNFSTSASDCGSVSSYYSPTRYQQGNNGIF